MNGETAQQFAYRLRAQGQQDANVIFAQLAEGFFGFRLKTGHRVFTLDDAVQFMYELAEAVKYQDFPEGTKFPESTKVHQMPERSTRPTGRDQLGQPMIPDPEVCPRCEHVHHGLIECGEQLGGGRTCRCELPVPA